MSSPYEGKGVDKWLETTTELLRRHPLSRKELVEVVLTSWKDIFSSAIGEKPFRIGSDIFPKPQIMGFFLHELIPLELSRRYPDQWRIDTSTGDKDIVCIPNPEFSIEIKTSSNPRHIFGNRSYAQGTTKGKKAKSGYYLTVNFESFSEKKRLPRILQARFGWIDSTDWVGQDSPTGQQSHLSANVEDLKLIRIYP